MKETVTLNRKEQKTLLVLNLMISGQITGRKAAELLNRSVRQVRRTLAAYRQEGAAALAHGNRGRRPHNALPAETRQKVIELARTKYQGYNHQHLTEELVEKEGLQLSRSSVRRILREVGMASPRKRRAPKHRSRRERYPQEGMLMLIDGSRHDWLEGRGPRLTLIAGVDDATGKVPYALFRYQEDAQGYFLLMRGVVETYGRPLAIYRDRHAIFERSKGERETIDEQLAGKREPTQFGRLLEELEITSIAARSPQAKGRAERLFGTFQDRLVSELRSAGASTIEEANAVLCEYLPRFNRRFAVEAAQPGLAYRPLEEGVDLDEVFCFKYWRTVGADNVVRLGEHRIQLLPSAERASYAKARVEIHERLDGSLAIYYQGRKIASQAAPAEAPVLRARHRGQAPRGEGAVDEQGVVVAGAVDKWAGRRAVHLSTARPEARRPSADHPWRGPFKQARVTNSLNT